MAGILHEFVQNTKILASQVNENFATVQSDMTELGSGLNTALTNAITAAKNDLLEDIESVSSNKASKDLSDAEPSAEFKANILDYVAPDYTAGYSISSGWAAPKAGWIYPYHYNTADNQELVVTIDGAEVFRTGDAGTWSTGHGASGFIFVRKGKTVAFSGYGNNTVKFYPCAGN